LLGMAGLTDLFQQFESVDAAVASGRTAP
jgi:hypothetical protein